MTPEQKLTPEQHAELNAWIAENVFGGLAEFPSHPDNPVIALAECPKFTTSPADAMAVLEKCADYNTTSITKQKDGSFVLEAWNDDETAWLVEQAETLPLAICLFSKALFEKESAK